MSEMTRACAHEAVDLPLFFFVRFRRSAYRRICAFQAVILPPHTCVFQAVALPPCMRKFEVQIRNEDRNAIPKSNF